MRLRYRILSIDEDEFCFVVRFFTDVLTERMLRTHPEDNNDPPLQCRTDYNLNLWRNMEDEEQMHTAILRAAPIAWLGRKERTINKGPEYLQSLAPARAMLDVEYARDVMPNETVDMVSEPEIIDKREVMAAVRAARAAAST